MFKPSSRNMTLLLILFAFFIIWFVKYLIELQLFKAKLKDFKCPPQSFLLGHLPVIAKDILGSIKTYIKEHGKLLHINATFFAPVLFISDHNVIKHILTSSSLINKGRIYEVFDSFAANSLAVLSEDIWYSRRRIMNPAFTVQNVESSLHIFNSAAAILADKLGGRQDQEIEIKPLLELCTLDATFELFLGTKLNSQTNENNVVNMSTRELHAILRKKMVSPWTLAKFIYVFTPMYWRERAAVKALSAENKRILLKHRSDAQRGDVKGLTPFMRIMMEGQLDDANIVTEINAFIFESRDTVGSIIASALHLLGHHPNIQDRVVEELKMTFNNDISAEDIRELKYLEAVIKETMRLYPAAPFIGRRFDKDQIIDGILIPANINVIMCIHALHNTEEHFPEPDVFNPDRFYENESEGITPFTYIPFSAGPRNCIGQKQAMSQIKVVLAHILRRYELLPVGETKISMVLEAVLTPVPPVKLKIKPREFK